MSARKGEAYRNWKSGERGQHRTVLGGSKGTGRELGGLGGKSWGKQLCRGGAVGPELQDVTQEDTKSMKPRGAAARHLARTVEGRSRVGARARRSSSEEVVGAHCGADVAAQHLSHGAHAHLPEGRAGSRRRAEDRCRGRHKCRPAWPMQRWLLPRRPALPCPAASRRGAAMEKPPAAGQPHTLRSQAAGLASRSRNDCARRRTCGSRQAGAREVPCASVQGGTSEGQSADRAASSSSPPATSQPVPAS